MPPMVASDDEDESRSRSAVSSEIDNEVDVKDEEVDLPVKKSKGRPKKQKVETPPPDDDEEEEAEQGEEDADMEGSEEDDEDVYVVEAIINHLFDEEGTLKFHVRWKDFPKIKDHTWEPEENLDTASEVLNEYIESVGGREALAKVPRPKKRGRASTNGTPSGSSKTTKKARKGSEDVKSEKTPERTKPTLPPGNWEDLIASIDTMDRHVSGYWVLLTFKDGTRVKQPTSTVYKRCPQKMLKFYESHLSITPATRAANERTDIEI